MKKSEEQRVRAIAREEVRKVTEVDISTVASNLAALQKERNYTANKR